MVEQISPEDYFKESNKIKEKVKKEKEYNAKKAGQEIKKAKMIFKPGQQPMMITMPPVKVIINLSHCPHCGLPVDAHAEIEEEEKENA